MAISKQALLDFVEWIETHPDQLTSFENGSKMLGAIGFDCRLTCSLSKYPAMVIIHAASPDYLDPMGIEVVPPTSSSNVILNEVQQKGPNTYERKGSFEWPMDKFYLRIEWEGKYQDISILGPYLARRAEAYLSEDTSPGVPIWEIGSAVSKLLFGRGMEENGPYLGVQMNAEWRGIEIAKMLKKFIINFKGDQPGL